MQPKSRHDIERLFMRYLTPPGSYVVISIRNRDYCRDCVIRCQYRKDWVHHRFEVPWQDDMEDVLTMTYRLLKEYLDKEYMKVC